MIIWLMIPIQEALCCMLERSACTCCGRDTHRLGMLLCLWIALCNLFKQQWTDHDIQEI